jgi:4-carboxymuconolactone decarboxylase
MPKAALSHCAVYKVQNDAPLEAVAARTAAREARILGHPPRIQPMSPEEFTPEVWALKRRVDHAAGLAGTNDYVSEWLATVLRHPTLLNAHTALAVTLMAGLLPARDRELAVLRTGWLCQAPFEWSGHVELAKRVARMTDEEIEWITIGSTAPGWSAHDRAVLAAVEEMLGNGMISDETWAVLARSYDEPQLIELPVLVGQYLGVAFLQNSLRVVLPDGYQGLHAR